MRLTGVLITVSVAVVAQAIIARYTAGGRATIDLVLVGVLYAGLRWGPVAGILAGTLGGLLQDMMAGDVVGVGGLAKTLVGFAAGAFGAQFVLVRPPARMVIVAVATVLHRLIVIGLYALIGSAGATARWPGVPWSAVFIQTGLNAACALIVFQASEGLPGAVQRSRARRRAMLSRRKW